MAERYEAKIDQFALEMQDISDQFEKAILRHEIPDKDGAKLKDSGLKARTNKFRCYFYNETYPAHIEFLNHLEKREDFELIHPVYGIITGKIESVSVRHDGREETAEIDISFVENLHTDIEPIQYTDIAAETEALFENAQLEQTEEINQDIIDVLEQDAGLVLDVDLDPSIGIIEQFQSISGKARDFVSTVDSYVTTFEATLTDITNPANSLIATIEYATDLPGRIVSDIAKVVERYSLLYDTIKNAPDRFVQSFFDGIAALKAAFPQTSKNSTKQSAIDIMQKQIQIAAAQRSAVDTGEAFKQDELIRQKQKRLENQKSFDAAGKYIKPEPLQPVLTVIEIEKTLYTVREQLQESVDNARKMQSLKDMARELLDHVNIIKLEREKIITVELDNPMPMHIVCLRYGLPYNAADRLLAINPQIKNPNFVSGEVNIYAG